MKKNTRDFKENNTAIWTILVAFSISFFVSIIMGIVALSSLKGASFNPIYETVEKQTMYDSKTESYAPYSIEFVFNSNKNASKIVETNSNLLSPIKYYKVTIATNTQTYSYEFGDKNIKVELARYTEDKIKITLFSSHESFNKIWNATSYNISFEKLNIDWVLTHGYKTVFFIVAIPAMLGGAFLFGLSIRLSGVLFFRGFSTWPEPLKIILIILFWPFLFWFYMLSHGNMKNGSAVYDENDNFVGLVDRHGNIVDVNGHIRIPGKYK